MDANSELYNEFINNFILLLEEFSASESLTNNPKSLAQLRNAERSFNFLLDRLLSKTDYKMMNPDEILKIKERRDAVAETLSTKIESSEDAKSYYLAYCENLKDFRKISAFL